MSRAKHQSVQRRRVFYFPGYDPVHSRKYRELYRKEAAAQAQISGYEISLAARQSEASYGWRIDAQMDRQAVSTDMEVLVWSDIVRNSMSNSIPATYRQLFQVAWTYIGSGALWRLMRLRKGPVIAALYPVVFLLLQLLLALGLTWGLGALGAGLAGWIGALVGMAVGVTAGALVIRWFRARDNLFYIYYLLHNYAYSAQHQGVTPDDLTERLAEFTDMIAEALQTEVDEVLIVGHSSGAHLAVSVLADLIRTGRVPDNGPALAFLSLGQVVPMVAFLPRAFGLRADLQYLSTRDELTWIDVTAPGDGCTFALCDPVTVCGVASDGKKWPLVVSAAFSQTLKPETWAALRWKFFRLHFQYLCAFDAPGEYDYFAITAGPRTLAERYAGRAPSKSRIERAVSKYTSVRAA